MQIIANNKWFPYSKIVSDLYGFNIDMQRLYILQAFAVLILWLQFVSNYTLIA
jgi:hypothetical protein